MSTVYDDMNKKTSRKIQKSFLELLKTTPFHKLSVGMITTHAQVNRGTFYLHYLDKFDLLDKVETTLLEGFDQYLKMLNPIDFVVSEEDKQISTFAVEVFEYIQANEEKFRILLSENSQEGFSRRLKQFLVTHFEENMVVHASFFEASSVRKEYLSSFATSAFLGLIEQWLENDLEETPREMAEMFIAIIVFIKNLE